MQTDNKQTVISGTMVLKIIVIISCNPLTGAVQKRPVGIWLGLRMGGRLKK